MCTRIKKKDKQVMISSSSLSEEDYSRWVRGKDILGLTISRKGKVLRIKQNRPTDHVMGLKLRTGDGVSTIVLDRGIYSGWTFVGETGSDTLRFGPQGTIISKHRGGVVKFTTREEGIKGRNKFIFTNTINVARTSEKHGGIPIHVLNHLQQVTIKNFSDGDLVILQGKQYTYTDLRGGAFPGVPSTRLKVNPS